MEVSIGDKIVNVIIDSGASCNLMSQRTFDLLFVFLNYCIKPLKLQGSCKLSVRIPERNVNKQVDFCVVPGDEPTLLGRELSESIGIRKVRINASNVAARYVF